MTDTKTKRPSVEELIQLWQLVPMETENVLFAQTYVSPKIGADGKVLSTAIIALLTDAPQSFSDMHRLPTDEIWHFYLGDAIELLLLDPNGVDEIVILGPDVLQGERIQYVVPAGVWMGARLRPGGTFGVFGNTMAPGYSLDDFEGGIAEELALQWPQRADLIRALTRPAAPPQSS
ncbi:MAG: cupin domain-containing protein, partial [Acidobacteriota bacterium]